MKTTIFSLILTMIIPAISSAKVEDFNAMINENLKSQSSLQEELKNNMNEARVAQEKAPKSRETLEIDGGSHIAVVSPTKKSLLTFKKEDVYYRASESKQLERLANEIKASDLEF